MKGFKKRVWKLELEFCICIVEKYENKSSLFVYHHKTLHVNKFIAPKFTINIITPEGGILEKVPLVLSDVKPHFGNNPIR